MATPSALSRLGSFPHSLNILALLFLCITLLCLAFPSDLPPGSSVIYGSVSLSILISLVHSATVIFVLDQAQITIYNVEMPVLIFGSSLLLVIFNFLSIWLTIDGWIQTQHIAFIGTLLSTTVLTLIYFMKFLITFREWQRNRRSNGTFDMPPTNNYGSS